MSPARRGSRSDSTRGSRRSDSRRGSRRDDGGRSSSSSRSSSSRSSSRGRSGRGDDRRQPPGRGGGRYSDRDDRDRDDRDRDDERLPRGKPKSNDTMIIVGGVGAAVVVIGVLALAMSGKKPPPRPRSRKTTAVAPKRLASPRDWYATGMREGYEWKSHARARAPMAGGAGGGGDPFSPANVRKMADMMTSNWYNKGLRNDVEGQKRFIDGFCRAVLGR